MRNCKNLLTPEKANELFSYDSETGLITRKISTGPRGQKGTEISSRQVFIDGRFYCVKRTAWLLLHGEYPKSKVICLDGNDENFKAENLMILPGRGDHYFLNVDSLRRLFSYDKNTGLIHYAAFVEKNRPGDDAGWVHSGGYKCINVGGEKIYAHRLAYLLVNGVYPDDVIDHINGNRADNRWENLRSVDQRTNAENLTNINRTHSKSRILGVHWCNQKQAWHAEIKTHGKKRHIGFFQDKNKAHEAYLKIKREIHLGCTL